MNPLHILLLPCVLAVSLTGSADYTQGRGGYGLLRPNPNYSGYNGGYNGYNNGYGGYGGGYNGYNPGFGGPGIGSGQGYPSNYQGGYGGYGGYPGYSGGQYGGNRPYNRPGYDGRPNNNYVPSNYQSNYPGYRPGYNQYRPGFDRPYQGNGYFDGVRDGYDNFGLLGRKVSEIKKDDA